MLTFIPSDPASLESDSEKPSTPNFAAAYAARPIGPTRPPIDDIWMTYPEVRSRKSGSNASVNFKCQERTEYLEKVERGNNCSRTRPILPENRALIRRKLLIPSNRAWDFFSC